MPLRPASTDSALAASLQSRVTRTLTSLLQQASPSLPALESTCRKVLSLSGNMSGTDRLSQILRGDPALTCKVLQVANSIAYSPKQPITSIPHAVTWLGLDTVRGLVDSAPLVEHLHQRPASRHIVNGVIARALAAAVHATELGMAARFPSHALLFTCTLLYSVGDFAIANQDPDLYQSLRRLSPLAGTPADRAAKEAELLGVPKLRLTQALAQMWSLPPDLVELLATAHERLPERWLTDAQQLKGLVEGTSALVASLTGPVNPALTERLKRGLRTGLGLSDEEHFAELLGRALERSHQLVLSAGLSLDGWGEKGTALAALQKPAPSATASQTVEHAHAAITTNPQDTLRALQVALADAKDAHALLETLVKRLHRDGGFRRVALALVRPKDPDELKGQVILGVKDRTPYLSTLSGSLSQDHPFFRHVINSTEPEFVEDFTTPLCAPLDPAFLHVWNPGSAILAPLRAGTRPIGMIVCDGGPFPHQMHPTEMQAFMLFYQPAIACLGQLTELE